MKVWAAITFDGRLACYSESGVMRTITRILESLGGVAESGHHLDCSLFLNKQT
jgi:hypothetical protein